MAKISPELADKLDRPLAKLPYSRPNLQMFGRLHHLTQASNNGPNDALNQPKSHSDPAVKENIERIGTHPTLGIGLYLYDYKAEFRDAWGHGRQFGVMADEVEQIVPEAVSLHSDGYKQVNYALLGIERVTN